jgi:phenylalanyl-tRNA synthetase alpha subunit
LNATLVSLANIRTREEKDFEIKMKEEAKEMRSMIHLLIGHDKNVTSEGLKRGIINKLNAKMYSRIFNNITSNQDNAFKKFAQDLRDKRTYMKLCKRSSDSSVQSSNVNNHLFKYFNECKDRHSLALPILFKIINKRLKLDNYTLNKESIRSLAKILV